MATSWKPRERRARKRIAVRFGEAANSPGMIGFTTNLSFHGLCITARTVHPKGTELRVDIQLSEGKSCRASGTVVWSKPALPHLALPGSMGVRVDSAEPSYRRYLQLLQTREAEVEPPEPGTPTPPTPAIRVRTPPAAPPEGEPGRTEGRHGGRDKAHPPQSGSNRSIVGRRPHRAAGGARKPAAREPANLEDLFADETDPIESGLLLPIDEGEETPSQSGPPLVADPVHATLRRGAPAAGRSRLIALAGVSGSGKDELLRAVLKRLGREVIALPDLGGMDVTLEQIIDAERSAAETGHHRVVISPHTLFDRRIRWTRDDEAFWQQARSNAADQQGRYYAVIVVRPPIAGQGGDKATVQAQRAIEAAWAKHPRRHVVDWQVDFEQRVTLFERHVTQYLAKSDKGLPPPPAETTPIAEPTTRMVEVKQNAGPLIHRDRAPRLRARLPLRYGRARPLTLSGMSVNFSRSGFSFNCETTMSRGETVMFTIDLPGGEACRGTGTVVWSRAARDEPGVALGVRLQRVHESYFQLLESLATGS